MIDRFTYTAADRPRGVTLNMVDLTEIRLIIGNFDICDPNRRRALLPRMFLTVWGVLRIF